MITLNVREAKRQFSRLLDYVAAGEDVVITRFGKPVARLIGVRQFDWMRTNGAFKKLKTLRKSTTLGGLSWPVPGTQYLIGPVPGTQYLIGFRGVLGTQYLIHKQARPRPGR